MPLVTLLSDTGWQSQESGGCFGFTGRNRSPFDYPAGSAKINTFRYHFGNQWGSSKCVGKHDPRPFLKWVAGESCWSHYIKEVKLPESSDALNNFNFDIRTDVAGHAVIGTASLIRFASHRKDTFIPFANLCAEAGGNFGIALLVYYALWGKTNQGITFGDETLLSGGNGNTITQGSMDTMGLGDDEVMDLSHINPYDIYGILNGTFRYPQRSCPNYEDKCGYEEYILVSFRSSGQKSFGRYLLDRFAPPPPRPDVTKAQSSGGMGRSVNFSLDYSVSLNPGFLIGIVLQLTSEYAASGEFKGYF